MYVRISSVTIAHPAKAIRRNEMQFGYFTLVKHCITDGPQYPTGRGDFGSELPVRSNAAFCQTTLLLVVVVSIS